MDHFDTLVYHNDKRRRLRSVEYINKKQRVIRVDTYFKHPGLPESVVRYDEVRHLHGTQQSWWDRWHQQPKEYATYRHGICLHKTTFYPNGQVRSNMYIQDMIKTECGFYSNSRRRYIKTWRWNQIQHMWERDGIWTGWYKNGNTTYVEEYKDHELISDTAKYWQYNGIQRTPRVVPKHPHITIRKCKSNDDIGTSDMSFDTGNKVTVRDISSKEDSTQSETSYLTREDPEDTDDLDDILETERILSEILGPADSEKNSIGDIYDDEHGLYDMTHEFQQFIFKDGDF